MTVSYTHLKKEKTTMKKLLAILLTLALSLSFFVSFCDLRGKRGCV